MRAAAETIPAAEYCEMPRVEKDEVAGERRKVVFMVEYTRGAETNVNAGFCHISILRSGSLTTSMSKYFDVLKYHESFISSRELLEIDIQKLYTRHLIKAA